ncbi:MAG: biotin--[acetyl-CoA-carboxylase] ligase [Pirellulaceae bacterium]|nr:MAG: biotin--[acetyl-CoA-carboxylase] ligase [Pirellulaceae bacterium]
MQNRNTSSPVSVSSGMGLEHSQSDWDLGRLAAAIHPAELVYFEQVESTNDIALERCRAGTVEDALLVLARQQTRGRGRGANRWWACDGALTFSWVPEARCTARVPESLVPLATGLAVVRALEERRPPLALGLKWPNDILLAGRKLGGILVEKASMGQSRLVIGIGLNVNNSMQQAPAEVKCRAVCWGEATGQILPRVPLLIDILSQWHQVIELLAKDRDRFLEEWRERCLLAGRYVEIDLGKQRLTGQCQGIDASGALCVATPSGAERISWGTVLRAEGLF